MEVLQIQTALDLPNDTPIFRFEPPIRLYMELQPNGPNKSLRKSLQTIESTF